MGRHSSVVRGKQASSRSPPGEWIPLYVVHNQVRQVCLCSYPAWNERTNVSHFPRNQNSFRVIRLRANEMSRHPLTSTRSKDFPLSEPTSKLPGTHFDLAGGYAAKLSSLYAPGRDGASYAAKSAPCRMRSMFGDVRNPGIIRLPLADETT